MKSILIVDDNFDGGRCLQVFLQLQGYHVTLVDTGLDALTTINHRMPECVILDIGLPDMTGYEVARKIRESACGSAPLIIAASGWGNIEDQRKAIEAGCDVHRTKPLDITELQDLLTKHETKSPL
jgi:CheY-like chemotaxis protein